SGLATFLGRSRRPPGRFRGEGGLMSSSRAVVVAVVLSLLALFSGPAGAQTLKPPTKITADLVDLHARHSAGVPLKEVPSAPTPAAAGWVTIDAAAAGDPAALAADLAALGARNVAIAGRLV